MILNQFKAVGKSLFSRGLVCSNSGNLSIRMGEKLIITRRGSNLGSLEEDDLIETGIYKNDRSTPLASVELPVHRAIYKLTQARAVVHAHCTHAVALSLAGREINSEHLEGLSGIGPVPVLGWKMEVKSGLLSDVIAEALKEKLIVVVYGHGTFAVGQLLEEALNCTTGLEEGCEIICLLKSMQKEPA
jgi:L-fuculose-phosphate aldolase